MLEFMKWYLVDASRVAPFTVSTELWDTSLVMPNLKAFRLRGVMDNDELVIYGVVEHMLSVLKGIEVDLEFGGMDRATANAMTGRSSTTSGSGASETRLTRYEGGQDLGYFGMIARLKAQGGGDAHVKMPRLKLNEDLPPELNNESQFVAPNVTAKGGKLRKADDSQYPLYDLLEHATLTAIESDFNTAFAALS